MPPLWSWLRRVCACSRSMAAPPRPSRRPWAKVSFDVLEDRLAPSVAAAPSWRNQKFQVDDIVVRTDAPVATAAANYTNQSFGSLIGLDQVFATSPYRGAGYSVAVIDTGIDYNHPDLGGGWGKRVIAGWDFVNNDADPMDDNGHGTHVAGIIGSSNASYAGVAPNVNLIGLKVLGADGSGSYGAVADALDWVLANRTKYNIVSINLSLGSGNFTVNPYDFLEADFAALKSQGVFISVAAGNSFYSYQGTPGLAYPGVSSNVVSVGAVWDADFGAMAWGSGARDNSTAPDRIASFSQRSANLSIFAPGAMITSTYLGGRYQQMAGTSMASPVIAGAAALLHQALDAAGKSSLATEDGILALMKSTGVRIVDGDDENDNVANTGLAFQRLNLAAAMQAVGRVTTPTTPNPPTNTAPTIAPIADQTIAPGGALTVGLSALDAERDPLVFSARIVGMPADSGDAYRLKQSLGLFALSSYFTNAFGLNEKWLGGANGAFYTILPNGEVRRWTGTAASTVLPANLIATLDAKFYNDPSLLLNAQPAAENSLSVSVAGNQLTVSAANKATGSYQVEVAASDGRLTATTTFHVVISNAPPLLAVADHITAPAGATRVAIPITTSDPEGDALTVSAAVAAATDDSSVASQLKAAYGLAFAGSYFTGAYGLGEKWLKSTNGLQFYCILPSGELHKFTGSIASLTSSTTLLATLDKSFYDDPSRLWNAPAISQPRATATVVGNQIILQLQAAYRGAVSVDITVSDALASVKRTVVVTFP